MIGRRRIVEPTPRPPAGPAWVVWRDGPWLEARLAREVRSDHLTTRFGESWLLIRALNAQDAERQAAELFSLVDGGDPWARCVCEMVRHDVVFVDDEGGYSLAHPGMHACLHPVFHELARQRAAEAAEVAERERLASIRARIAELEGELGAA